MKVELALTWQLALGVAYDRTWGEFFILLGPVVFIISRDYGNIPKGDH